jgi:catalase
MVDAVFVPGGKESIATLSKNGRAIHWIREAFGHLKTIAATGEGVDLLNLAFQLPSIQLSSNEEAVESYGVVTQRNVKPENFSETVEIAKEAKGFLEKFYYSSAQHRNWARELDGLNAMVAY